MWGGWAALILAMLMAMGCAVLSGTDQEDENEKQARWHYEMGTGYFESQDITHAIRELTMALEYDPDHADAHYLLGFIYMGRRNHTRAVQHFREALRVDPQYHSAKNNLGTVYMAMERWEEAAELFEDLLDEVMYTTPELAHNNLGWSYFHQGRHSEALEHLRMAVYLSPDMCLAENNKGRVYEATGNERDAERHFRRAIDKCPQSYQEPHFYLGRLLQRRDDDRAAAHFQRCVEISSSNNLADRCREYLGVY